VAAAGRTKVRKSKIFLQISIFYYLSQFNR
jgi:hypothetical protein